VWEQFDEPEAVRATLTSWRISYMDEPPSERFTAAVAFMADGRRDGIDAALRLAEVAGATCSWPAAEPMP